MHPFSILWLYTSFVILIDFNVIVCNGYMRICNVSNVVNVQHCLNSLPTGLLITCFLNRAEAA